jgi:hypothetical protein
MDQQTMRNLRLDRRLIGRRGWPSPQEIEADLAKLPDVAAKIAPPEEEEPAPGPSPSGD